VLRRIKTALFTIARGAGAVKWCLNSDWRQQRLLILCYHGTSLADEHLWDPDLYIQPDRLRRRLTHLRNAGCSVLPLPSALQRLYNGTLPPRSVAITYDDGTYDFYQVALPVIREFSYPVTVYLTTYYSDHNQPVFNVMLRYLLWKAQGRALHFPEVVPEDTPLTEDSRPEVAAAFRQFAAENALSGSQKDLLLERLAQALEINYPELRQRRLLQLMTPEEAREAARSGVDVQLHTHRHRLYDSRPEFQGEIEENRRRVESITGRPANHFCYPAGCHLPEFPQWLGEMGVLSATTTETGIATRSSNPFLLPRLIDTSKLSSAEFAAWVSGLAALLPRREQKVSMGPLVRAGADLSAGVR
jgi:peptidoglycan/xylan/chitin deacetylase (PgdA/CDA1 family)